MKLGYELLTSGNFNNHQEALKALEREGCQQIITDVSDSKPYLARFLEEVQPGDILVVPGLDRLGNTLHLVVQTLENLLKKEANLKSLEEGILISANSENVERFLRALMEIEHRMSSIHTQARFATAIKEGKKGGRPKRLEERDLQAIRVLLAKGCPVKHICESYGISRSTYYGYFPARKR